MNILDSRKCGVLFHISSLPGDTGIGTLGENAYRFVDLLSDAEQTYWQILPVGPTSYGDSPYQSYSTFAGNPYFIDFDTLEKQGYLKKEDYQSVNWGDNPSYADYGLLYENRRKVFSVLYENFKKNIPSAYNNFCKENKFWLEDYALFMTLKELNNYAAFTTWPEDIRCKEPKAVAQVVSKNKDKIEYYKMLQFFFFEQWKKLKAYANSKGINIIGDIPIYVAADSADVWSCPKLFQLDDKLIPLKVAGCPPDAFSATGQLWGNPVYNWKYQAKTKYEWWNRRLAMSFKTYDVLRVDHFRGFDSYYCIPYGAQTAENGKWEKGPGIALFNTIKKNLGSVPLIAEDLGFLTDSVKQLLKDSGFPGMKVLQFAFNPDSESEYLPFNHIQNSIVYTGTHDNETIIGWTNNSDPREVENAMNYYRISQKDQMLDAMMLSAIESVSNTCIVTMQDLIGLGSEARMNMPSTQGSNWKWRATKEQIEKVDFEKLRKYTILYGRRR